MISFITIRIFKIVHIITSNKIYYNIENEKMVKKQEKTLYNLLILL